MKEVHSQNSFLYVFFQLVCFVQAAGLLLLLCAESAVLLVTAAGCWFVAAACFFYAENAGNF